MEKATLDLCSWFFPSRCLSGKNQVSTLEQKYSYLFHIGKIMLQVQMIVQTDRRAGAAGTREFALPHTLSQLYQCLSSLVFKAKHNANLLHIALISNLLDSLWLFAAIRVIKDKIK